MSLSLLKINKLRNLKQLEIQANPRFNVIVGENGAGKTSILEAIHLLSIGRSFRTRINSRLITHGEEFGAVFGVACDTNGQEINLGVERKVEGKSRFRVDNVDVNSIATHAERLPTQLINPDGYKLIEGGPVIRRQFLDWGVFHVEHEFYACWQRFQKILKQRNAALKNNASKSQLKVWDEQLILASNSIDEYRKSYFSHFLMYFESIADELLPFGVPDLRYYSGWSADVSYAELLDANYVRDIGRGHTTAGPHRADIRITMNNIPAKDVLSRGQQKLFVNLMRLIQGKLLQKLRKKPCIYLIDDLTAELDRNHQRKLIKSLGDLDAQVFITTISPDDFVGFIPEADCSMFHVEHGIIVEKEFAV